MTFTLLVLHFELCLFITLSVTLTLFQGLGGVKHFKLKMLCSYSIKLKLYRIVKYIRQVMDVLLLLTFAFIQGDNWRVLWFDRNFIVSFFKDTVQARFFKLYIIKTLPGLYQFIPGLITLTLFQGHRCVRILNCKSFLGPCPL